MIAMETLRADATANHVIAVLRALGYDVQRDTTDHPNGPPWIASAVAAACHLSERDLEEAEQLGKQWHREALAFAGTVRELRNELSDLRAHAEKTLHRGDSGGDR